jgi:hypothetical protein
MMQTRIEVLAQTTDPKIWGALATLVEFLLQQSYQTTRPRPQNHQQQHETKKHPTSAPAPAMA